MSEQEEIRNEFQRMLMVELSPGVSRDDLLRQLAVAVSGLLEQNADAFFQLMYRLDISEQRLNEALKDKLHAVDKIASLIYERQIQKLHYRRQSPEIDPDDDDLRWVK